MIGNKYPSHTVMDVRIHAVTMEEALRCAREMAASGEEHIIATANAEMVMIAQEDKELAYVLNHCSLVVPDGAGILWAGEQLGTYFPARVAGADYAEEILKIAVKEKWPVYFLGGAPGVAETAIRRFTERYGLFEKAGFHDGYFDKMEEQKIVEEIKSGGTKVLLCGMGVPKQEKWLWNHKKELGPVLAMGVGGVFDVMAGNLRRAPLWMRNHRLEWAYRLYLQPSRIGRMAAIPKFMLAIKKWKRKNGNMLKKPIILPEGYPFIIISLIVAALLWYFGMLYTAVIPFVFSCYFCYFFRCPRRNAIIPPGEDTIVSPADGTVVDVSHGVEEEMYLGEKCHKITIFLSVFDVHCNRSPMEGTIKYQSYTQGRFLPAYEKEVGFENERGAIGIEGKHRNILVILIAGILARRVVSWKQLGDPLQKGELYGMIKFGSCTELYIPGEAEICVKKGDTVRGGLTIVGRLKLE